MYERRSCSNYTLSGLFNDAGEEVTARPSAAIAAGIDTKNLLETKKLRAREDIRTRGPENQEEMMAVRNIGFENAVRAAEYKDQLGGESGDVVGPVDDIPPRKHYKRTETPSKTSVQKKTAAKKKTTVKPSGGKATAASKKKKQTKNKSDTKKKKKTTKKTNRKLVGVVHSSLF